MTNFEKIAQELVRKIANLNADGLGLPAAEPLIAQALEQAVREDREAHMKELNAHDRSYLKAVIERDEALKRYEIVGWPSLETMQAQLDRCDGESGAFWGYDFCDWLRSQVKIEEKK